MQATTLLQTYGGNQFTGNQDGFGSADSTHMLGDEPHGQHNHNGMPGGAYASMSMKYKPSTRASFRSA